MDKSLLKLLRGLLGLDSNTLPDSITPEDFSKLMETSASKLVKQEDFKNLQKALSEKDVENKKLADELKSAGAKKNENLSESEKKIAELSESVKVLTESISQMNLTQQTENLAKTYPDILPELLAGKTPEQVEAIVTKQREINKKLYGDSNRFAPPDYSSEAEIDEKVEAVKKDTTKSAVTSAVEVLDLSRKRAALSKE